MTDIRSYIKNNFKDEDADGIQESIEESIKSKEKILLPGLGVFFEILWNSSNDKERKNILKVLEEEMKKI